jgi:hypothetical protein
MLARTLAALLLLAACPKGPPTPTEPGANPGSAVDPAPGTGSKTNPEPGPGSATEPPRAGPKLGQPCGPSDSCGEGACVTYYGIAGPRGPAFKSCEIRCNPQGGCDGGRQCITVADGPGQVCRDPDPAR